MYHFICNMEPLIYPSKIFEQRCEEAGIEFQDVRHYCNEGTIYEFKTKEELMNATALYFTAYINDPEGFRVEISSVGDVHHLFDEYPDEL